MLFATRYLEKLGLSEKTIDNFWSIVVYFNSLRELGGASIQILDDVQSRFSYLAKTKFANVYPGVDADISYDNIVELTSRMNNSDITKVIQEGLKRSYSRDSHVDVYDFLLASNMISVGVDVGRLGAMVVVGQPKTNADIYRQPAVLEEIIPVLSSLYIIHSDQETEPIMNNFKISHCNVSLCRSDQPYTFSDRARDRGLHALLFHFVDTLLTVCFITVMPSILILIIQGKRNQTNNS